MTRPVFATPRPVTAGLCALLLAACGAADSCTPGGAETADLVLRGGNVISMADDHATAEAVAVVGSRIAFVGDRAGVEPFIGSATRIVELQGATVLPGLTDAHAHLMNTGRLKTQIDLLGSTTFAELLDSVAAAVERAEPGEWIVGRGWHQEKWTDTPEATVRGFPVHEPLSAVSPDNPVSIRHASGHGRLVNQRALEAAGITAETPDPPGGEILHLPDRRPSGMLLEEAEDLVEEVYQDWLAGLTPAEREAAERLALQAGVDEFLRNGITAVHDAGVSEEELALYREAAEAGELRMRIWAMLSASEANDASLQRLRRIPSGDERLTVRAIKVYADGALGSRGALLLEPYADDDTRGEEVSTEEELRRVTDLALRHGYQAATHAIGDRANRRALDVYEEQFERHPRAAADARFRIEHAQILHPDDVQRFADLGVTASMQGVHSTSDGPWTPARLGDERTRERAYPFRDLWDAGVLIVNGTDAPVERVNPWASIAGMAVGLMGDAAAAEDAEEPDAGDGEPGAAAGEPSAATGEPSAAVKEPDVFNPHHLLTREEALATYTINPAVAAFEENRRGSIEVGKLADLTVVDADPLAVPDHVLGGVGTLMTIVGGEVVYESDRLADEIGDDLARGTLRRNPLLRTRTPPPDGGP